MSGITSSQFVVAPMKSVLLFWAKLKHRLHIGFDDPSHATGTDEFIWSEFIRVREEIKKEFYKLYVEQIKPQL